MTIYEYTCITDSSIRLLAPKKEVLEAAKKYCDGEWKFFGQLEDELHADDVRVALNSASALEDIERQGFHIARFNISSSVETEGESK